LSCWGCQQWRPESAPAPCHYRSLGAIVGRRNDLRRLHRNKKTLIAPITFLSSATSKNMLQEQTIKYRLQGAHESRMRTARPHCISAGTSRAGGKARHSTRRCPDYGQQWTPSPAGPKCEWQIFINEHWLSGPSSEACQLPSALRAEFRLDLYIPLITALLFEATREFVGCRRALNVGLRRKKRM